MCTKKFTLYTVHSTKSIVNYTKHNIHNTKLYRSVPWTAVGCTVHTPHMDGDGIRLVQLEGSLEHPPTHYQKKLVRTVHFRIFALETPLSFINSLIEPYLVKIFSWPATPKWLEMVNPVKKTVSMFLRKF